MSFTITVGPKTLTHPFYNKGSKYCYYINDVPGVNLELISGRSYEFKINTPGHPFYLTSSETGGSEDNSPIGNFPPTDNGTITYTVPSGLPNNFYYQCKIHSYMGGNASLSTHNTFYLSSILKDLTAPTSLTSPIGSQSIYVADQIGLVYEYNAMAHTISIFLDVREYIPMLNKNYDERGLLGLCFHPNYMQNGRFYIYYSSKQEREASTYPKETASLSAGYYNCLSEFTNKDGKVLYEAEKVLIKTSMEMLKT